VESEISRRNEQLDQQLQQAGLTRADYLRSEGKSTEDFDNEVAEAARQAVRGGFVLDQLALQEDLGVENEELSEYVVTQAMQMGVEPQQLAQHLTESGQLPALVSEVLRNKALNLIVEHVKVTEESGTELDVEAIRQEISGENEAGEADEADEADGDSEAVEATEATEATDGDDAAAAAAPAAKTDDKPDA
jgi:trigger factor